MKTKSRIDKIINLNEYKFHKNTAQRLEKSDFTEKIRLELKEKIKNQKINGASFMIFDDFICSTKQKLEKELKKN